MNLLRRIDRWWASLEGVVLIALFAVLVLATACASVARLFEQLGLAWAEAVVHDCRDTGSLTPRLTMCIAMLGASLAAYHQKHLASHVVLRVVPLRVRRWMIAIQGLLASAILMCLVYSFFSAVVLELYPRRIEGAFEGIDRSVDICDASDLQLAEMGLSRPVLRCLLRATLGWLGLPTGDVDDAVYFVVPLELFVIALRFLFQGARAIRGEVDEDAAAGGIARVQ